VTHLLAFKGEAEELHALLHTEPRLAHLRDVVGCTALHWACAGGQVSAARLLLLHGASAFAEDMHGSTPLHVAAKYGRPGAAQELLAAAGLQLLHAQDAAGKTPGECAADAKHWCALS